MLLAVSIMLQFRISRVEYRVKKRVWGVVLWLRGRVYTCMKISVFKTMV